MTHYGSVKRVKAPTLNGGFVRVGWATPLQKRAPTSLWRFLPTQREPLATALESGSPASTAGAIWAVVQTVPEGDRLAVRRDEDPASPCPSI